MAERESRVLSEVVAHLPDARAGASAQERQGCGHQGSRESRRARPEQRAGEEPAATAQRTVTVRSLPPYESELRHLSRRPGSSRPLLGSDADAGAETLRPARRLSARLQP